MASTIRRESCSYCGSSNNVNYWIDDLTRKERSRCMTPDCEYNKQKNNITYNNANQFNDLINSGTFEALEDRFISKDICELYKYQVASFYGKKAHLENYCVNDELSAQKIRVLPKQFLWVGNKNNVGFFGEHLYNNQSILYITEGAIDALSIAMALGTNEVKDNSLVVSLKEGAGKQTKHELENKLDFLSQFKIIVLAFDKDKAGKLAFDEAIKLFKPGHIYTLDFKYKDANEYLKNNALDELRDVLFNKTIYKPESIRAPSLETLLEKKPLGIPLRSMPVLNDSIRGVQERRLITIMAGSGTGKSTFTKKLVLDLLKEDPTLKIGVAYLEEPLDTSGISFMAMANDVPTYQLEENIEEFNLDLFRDSYEQFISGGRIQFIDAAFMKLDAPSLLYNLEYLIRVEKCKIIVLDHLTMITYDDGEQSERKDIDKLMKSLRELVHITGATIFLVVHLKRPSKGLNWDQGREISQSDGRGSAALEQLSDVMIGLERNMHDEFNKSLTKVKLLKNRITGKTGYVDTLVYIENTGQLKVL